jgi:hypothetical protein
MYSNQACFSNWYLEPVVNDRMSLEGWFLLFPAFIILVTTIIIFGCNCCSNGTTSSFNGSRAALTVTIDGNVTGNVQTMQGDIIVNGTVGGCATSDSGDMTINGDVNGSASSGSGDIRVNGNVSGDVNSNSGDVTYSHGSGGRSNTGRIRSRTPSPVDRGPTATTTTTTPS